MNKRVALISEHASPLATLGGIDAGGQNIAVAELANGLAQLGYSIDVFTRWASPAEPELVQWQPGVRVIHLPAGPRQLLPKEALLPYMDEFAQAMVQFIRREGLVYKLVHAHFFMSGLVAILLKQQLRLPFIITFHALGLVRRLYQGTSDGFPTERIAIEKQIIQEADGIIALCPQDCADLTSLYKASPDKISVIPNGYNPDDFFPVDSSVARRHIGVSQDAPLLLQLGRIVPRKGIATVIHALALLQQKKTTNTQLLIVGGESRQPDPKLTPEIGRLRALAEKLGVASQVRFVGSRTRNELRYYYSAADVFVTTPVYEPFGITPLEAMACGTPVVGSAVGGIKHTVIPDRTGFLIAPNDPLALANRLDSLLFNKRLRDQYRQAGIQHVRGGYTWAHVAYQTAEFYDLLATGRIHSGVWLNQRSH